MQHSNSKKSVHYLKRNDQDLQKIFTKTKELAYLNKKLLTFLDPLMRNHCQVANLKGTQLIILTANASVATQLRFYIPDLLKKIKINPAFEKITHISCIVRPATQARKTEHRAKVKPLSVKTAKLINEMAQSLKDEKLKKIMQSIAKRTTQSTE